MKIRAKIWIIAVLLLLSFDMKASQIKIANRAEQEILKYKDSNALWLKHICNFDARPTQLIWAEEIEANPWVASLAPPRFGKTYVMELMCLKDTSCNHHEDGRTWAPKEDQAKKSLKYQLSAIERSKALNAFIATRDGKRVKSTKGYEFWNRSNWNCFGQGSNFEGENATILRLEEFDDMDWDIYSKRILERGSAKNYNGLPTRVRITGTIQEGKGNMYRVVNDEKYYKTRQFDIHVGLAMGIYDDAYIEGVKKESTPSDWLRIYCLKFTEARNFIWEKWIRQARQKGLNINYNGVTYEPGGKYVPTGRVVAGMDMGHSGEGKTASVYSLNFYEIIGETIMWLNGKKWPATANTAEIKKDVVNWWSFYRPDFAYGDALKADMILDINDMLYDERLINTDRSMFAENSAGNWKKWDFSPVWNNGQTKWNGATILQGKLQNQKFVIPYFDDSDDTDIAKACRFLVKNLKNVRQTDSNARYGTLGPINGAIGDDAFDSSWMALLCANDRLPETVNLANLGTSGQKTTMSQHTNSIAAELLSDLRQNMDIERNF